MVTAAAVVWTFVVIAIGTHAFLNPQRHSIFPIYSFGAHAFWQGHSLYHGSGLGDEFQNGPLFAVGISPLAYLPARWGNALWKLFNVGIFLMALAAWLKEALPEPIQGREAAFIFLLALGDSLQCVYDGNSNLFVIAAILLAMAAIARGRNGRAGVWLASATLAKAFPLTLAALLTVVCGVAVAAPFALAMGAGLAVPIVVHPSAGLAQTKEWLGVLATRSDQRQIRHCSIDQLFRIYGHPLPISWSNALAAAAGLAALLLCVTYARRADRRSTLTFTLAAFSAWMLLFLPSLEAATLAVAAPSIALALLEARRRGWNGILVLLAISWWLLGPAVTDIAGSRARMWVQDSGAIPIGGLLFAICLVTLWNAAGQRIPQRVLQTEN